MTRYCTKGHSLLRLSLAPSTVVISFVLTACGGSAGQTASWDGSIRDSVGIAIVENLGRPLWGEGEAWEFTEVLRVGVAEGAPEYEFGRISGLAVLSDRRIVVADALAHQLRVFSPDGTYEQTVGRPGEGPGEFGSGSLGLLQGPADTILVTDGRNDQMHAFAPDGTWLGSFSTLPSDGYSYGNWDDHPATGRIVSKHRPLLIPGRPPVDTLELVLVRDVHGGVLDTLARIPMARTLSLEGDATLRHYYAPSTDFDLCGDGLVIGRSEAYRLLWYGPGGVVDRIITLRWEAAPMTGEDQARLLRRAEDWLRQYEVPLARVAQIKGIMRFESHYPAYRRFVCGPSSTVLVQHVRPVHDLEAAALKVLNPFTMSPPGTLEWDVFDRMGRFLGVVALPGTEVVDRWAPQRFVRDDETGQWYFYSVSADEHGAEQVVAWRLDGEVPD